MIRQIIENELEFEKMLLQKLDIDHGELTELLLTMSSQGKFYYRIRGRSERRYIRKSNRKLLRDILASRFAREKVKILKSNIEALEQLLAKVRDYDGDSIIGALPSVYSRAIDSLQERNAMPGVIQSENPKNRLELIVTCSNGLRVRTKVEMIIAEILIALGIEFRYEKALELVERIPIGNGTYRYRTKVVYPDFTITLADGTEIYWEHAGLFDKDSYRADQHNKFDIYYDNGIYPPKNLIITMDGPGKPISSLEIRSIVEALIMPRV